MITPFITCHKCGICQPTDAYPWQQDTCNSCVAAGRLKHQAKRAATKRRYWEKNRDRLLDAGRERRAKHRQQVADYVRELQLRNPEEAARAARPATPAPPTPQEEMQARVEAELRAICAVQAAEKKREARQ